MTDNNPAITLFFCDRQGRDDIKKFCDTFGVSVNSFFLCAIDMLQESNFTPVPYSFTSKEFSKVLRFETEEQRDSFKSFCKNYGATMSDVAIGSALRLSELVMSGQKKIVLQREMRIE